MESHSTEPQTTDHKPLVLLNMSTASTSELNTSGVDVTAPCSLEESSPSDSSSSSPGHSSATHHARLPPLLSGSSKSRSVIFQRTPSTIPKQRSLSHLSIGSSSSNMRCTPSPGVDPQGIALQTPQHGGAFHAFNMSPARMARITIGCDGISAHALDRLGVNTDILKKEKGMKKLGICDIDIERSEDIRRHSGLPLRLSENPTKAEIIFGFTYEQLMRVKAINVLGTTEEEVLDDYSKRVSMLGTHDTIPPIQ